MSRQAIPLGVVCDCMVFVQAVVNGESPAARIFELIETRDIRLYVCDQILFEVQSVLQRSELRARFKQLTDVRIQAFMKRVERSAFWARNVPRHFEYPRDPKDEPYINLAVAADAEFVISRDRDLLDLMVGHDPICKEFRQRFRRLRVVQPDEFLTEFEQGRNVPQIQTSELE